jgi:hypothetical protein
MSPFIVTSLNIHCIYSMRHGSNLSMRCSLHSVLVLGSWPYSTVHNVHRFTGLLGFKPSAERWAHSQYQLDAVPTVLARYFCDSLLLLTFPPIIPCYRCRWTQWWILFSLLNIIAQCVPLVWASRYHSFLSRNKSPTILQKNPERKNKSRNNPFGFCLLAYRDPFTRWDVPGTGSNG